MRSSRRSRAYKGLISRNPVAEINQLASSQHIDELIPVDVAARHYAGDFAFTGAAGQSRCDSGSTGALGDDMIAFDQQPDGTDQIGNGHDQRVVDGLT